MRISPWRAIAGVLLLADGLGAALGVAAAMPTILAHTPAAIVTIALGGMAGAVEAAGGWLLFARQPAGPAIARAGVLLAAVVTTLGIGLRLSPTNLDPAFRTPAVAGYWVFALVIFGLLKQMERGDRVS